MSNMPHMKREVAINLALAPLRVIYLYATVDAASTIRQFGDLAKFPFQNQYRLEIDPRYDFDEVKRWIEETYPLREL